jgi:hypothetical protein
MSHASARGRSMIRRGSQPPIDVATDDAALHSDNARHKIQSRYRLRMDFLRLRR